ncbi:MAG: MFS transporter [Candidatus Obscuribacterales bacterium]|nr:MFS transporter [Candidatus Obscuribacterales bacterium]
MKIEESSETPKSDEADAGRNDSLAATFGSFGQRNFRLYFFGQLVSLSGTWMQSLALSWLVYRLTNSPMALGIVESCTFLPILLFALAGGWLADRVDRRFIMLASQALMMVQAGTLAYLTYTKQIQLWHIVCLALVAGTVTAFEMPARQALLAQLVERKYLVNAISLNSSVFNASRIVGPALAAVMVAQTGEALCFGLNALSFLATLTVYCLIRPIKDDEKTNKKSKGGIREGLKFAFGTPEIARVLRQCLTLSLFGIQFAVLMPVMARDVLHLGVEGFGALRVAAGIGSLCAALSLATKGSHDTLLRIIGVSSIGFAMALCAFSISRSFQMSLFIALLVGLTLTSQLSGGHSLIQLKAPDELRGRIMSIWTITLLGVNPVGSLMSGWLATNFGAPPVLFFCSVCCMLSALIVRPWRR